MESHKVDILKHLNQTYWNQFNYHREKEYKIFIWTNAIFIAGVASLFKEFCKDDTIINSININTKILISLLLLIWGSVSIWLQIRQRINGDKYSGVIVRISKHLKCYEKNYFTEGDDEPLLPYSWQNWENEEKPKIKRLLRKNFIPVTFSIWLISIVIIWSK